MSRGRQLPDAAAAAAAAWSHVDASASKQGLTALHLASLYGQLAAMHHLVEAGAEGLDGADLRGRRPLHTVLSSQSSPNTAACLRYLLQSGAKINVTTNSGQTPLHAAASEGLLECTKMLVAAGADVLAEDNVGRTPLELARIWCRREVARYLKSCEWEARKRKEMDERTRLHALYGDLLDAAKLDNLSKKTLIDEKVAEWACRKGFPPFKGFRPRVQQSQYHSRCLASDPKKKHPQGSLKDKRRPPPSSIYLGLQPDEPLAEPDLRGCVSVWRDGGAAQFSTKWDRAPRAAPDLPLDALKRVLFPRDFPPRMGTPQHFEPQDVAAVQRRGCPQGQSTSHWTEVAMHLAEVLEPGHY